MKWLREGTNGMISEPFRVGKFATGDHLAYRLWCGTELLGEFNSFEECQAAAQDHADSSLREGGV